MEPIELILQIIGTSFGAAPILSNLRASKTNETVASKNDRFLNYNPSFLFNRYSKECRVANYIAYKELCNFSQFVPFDQDWDESKISIQIIPDEFVRDEGNDSWKKASVRGFHALLDSGRIKDNEPAIRVNHCEYDQNTGKVILYLQKAHYFDQAFSNLILDFDRNNPEDIISLRQQLETAYGNILPPLNEPKMANTLGIAALVFYKYGKQWVPYIVRRVSKVAVLPGGLVGTASGVAKWPDDPTIKTLFNYATKHMLSELEEEVGLSEEDLVDLRPIALCREMARGGKPQLFFTGYTNLNRKKLILLRKEAEAIREATNGWKEIERDHWYKSSDIVLTSKRLSTLVAQKGLTLEGAASLFYGYEYAKSKLASI